jgi:hypothetical protein
MVDRVSLGMNGHNPRHHGDSSLCALCLSDPGRLTEPGTNHPNTKERKDESVFSSSKKTMRK